MSGFVPISGSGNNSQDGGVQKPPLSPRAQAPKAAPTTALHPGGNHYSHGAIPSPGARGVTPSSQPRQATPAPLAQPLASPRFATPPSAPAPMAAPMPTAPMPAPMPTAPVAASAPYYAPTPNVPEPTNQQSYSSSANNNVAATNNTTIKPKSLAIAIILWVFLGGAGGHCFYFGKTGRGIAHIAVVIFVSVMTVLFAPLGAFLDFCYGCFLIYELYCICKRQNGWEADSHGVPLE